MSSTILLQIFHDKPQTRLCPFFELNWVLIGVMSYHSPWFGKGIPRTHSCLGGKIFYKYGVNMSKYMETYCNYGALVYNIH